MTDVGSSSFLRLVGLLSELFQFDRADLDFGLYRLMNVKRAEVGKFLERDLLPQVRDALFSHLDSQDHALDQQLTQQEGRLRELGMSELQIAEVPAIKELRERLAGKADISSLENDIYSRLYTFFSRYYTDGDFISLRRYKPGVYAIPYEGEEVKFHWATVDQYYVKSSEDFQDYRFKVQDGRFVHFRMTAADTERDNTKEEDGKERRFVLRSEGPVKEEKGELHVCFEYVPSGDKQAKINQATERRLLHLPECEPWRRALTVLAPSPTNSGRTLLEKHLAEYTARNTFDYFIHKDLGGFLRRELDFYIKNEVMHLDDLESESAPRVETYLSKVRIIRQIAGKIIDFLDQLEVFQKRLWLKKKFVTRTDWCVSLGTILQVEDATAREGLMQEIVANEGQLTEWTNLYGTAPMVSEASFDGALQVEGAILTLCGDVALPLSCMIDTRHFSDNFTQRLLEALGDLDGVTDGVLVHGENFQALQLMQARYEGQIKTIAIDPPYNRMGDGFPYKDNYQHSSWASMMRDRLGLSLPLMREDGALFCNIDENERRTLEAVLDNVFGPRNRIEELIWAQNTTHSQSPLYSTNHEYIEVYARNKGAAERAPDMFREPKPGYLELMELIGEMNPHYPRISEVEEAIKGLYNRHLLEYKAELVEQELVYDEDTKKQDPWRGLYNYSHAEYRDSAGRLVSEEGATRSHQANLVVWQAADASAPAQKQSSGTRDPVEPNYRFYRPLHPKTGQPCSHPKRGWLWPYEWPDSSRDSFVALDRAGRIAWGDDETTIPRFKRFVHEVETNVAKSFFHDYTDGEKQIGALFGITGLFPTPKPTTLAQRFVAQTAGKDGWVLDYFGGSGTTGHAVVKLNREDGGRRRFILVEMGHHFDAVLLPRLKKVAYCPEWESGKPKQFIVDPRN